VGVPGAKDQPSQDRLEDIECHHAAALVGQGQGKAPDRCGYKSLGSR
jgi:hypothetical protein